MATMYESACRSSRLCPSDSTRALDSVAAPRPKRQIRLCDERRRVRVRVRVELVIVIKLVIRFRVLLPLQLPMVLPSSLLKLQSLRRERTKAAATRCG